ncbi:flagellar hook-associated protein FlgL [Alkaliphilus pronyensis]|uniref:Flagellar hook-associated protein FlgL n=1 Tax=Alkaliphilus pronyensis TaxID=1482732 RepID=A0A6I0FTY1_9FIRM|nr:flagellar hook-associated protein FlgL [Alkaliphilus pronyensis]KAB3539674.1 flagellar hook-associated protein FlgL [Alkaliphilus pronyensis]
MRITNGMMITNLMQNLNRNMLRLDKTQLQAATGKRVHLPSDDPVAISRSLKIRADISELNQYSKNVNDAVSFLETTELAVKNVGDALQRLRELTVQASNGVLSEDDTRKIKGEVEEIKAQIISLGNTTYSGKYIFSGKKTDEPLFEFNNDPLVDEYEYNVDLAERKDPATVDDKMQFEVGVNETIEINTLGLEVFDIIAPDAAGDREVTDGTEPGIITMINQVIDNLENGDEAGLTADIEEIDKYLNVNLTARSEIGGKVNRMELVQNRIADDKVNFTRLQSQLEDADMAEVYMNLMNEENVYRSSLSIGARIIQPTLIDFLR